MPNADIGLALEVWIANVAVHAFVHSQTVFADYDQQQVFFRPRESGCERDLAIRVEAPGAVKLKLKAQLV